MLRSAGKRGQHDADRSLADDKNGFIGGKLKQLDGLENGVDRLDESRLFKGNAAGNPDDAAHPDDPIHHTDVLGEASAGGFKARCCADFFVRGALREGLLAAVIALAARDVMIDHYAIADGKVCDARAGSDNGARHLVAKDARSGVRSQMNLLQIRAADAACGDFDQQLARADCGHRHGFKAQIVYAAIDNGTHRSGDTRL